MPNLLKAMADLHIGAGTGGDIGVQSCMPTGCLLEPAAAPESASEAAYITARTLPDAVKVVCNNDQCTRSGVMHRHCFDVWETSVLNYLRSCGRARSWSERQRHQNLWTKKGYDLAYKVIFRLDLI